MPGHYWRAGVKKTKAQWIEIFDMDEYQFGWADEWFIDLTPTEPHQIDRVKEIVNQEFEREGLHSITYKEAAETCVRKALTEFCKNKIA